MQVTRSRVRSTDVLVVLLLAVVAARFLLPGAFDGAAVRAWSTVFVAVCLQALPFLVLGVLLSGAISTLVPPSFFARALPRRPALAVPVAGAPGWCCPAASAPRCRWPAAWSGGA